MALILNNKAVGNGPGLHALVVGVSQYDFLPGVNDPPKDATWGLNSLGCTALSAANVAEWLIREQNSANAARRLAQPLTTLSVLLSPTEVEKPLLPPWAAPLVSTKRDEFRIAARQWHEDCQSHPDNIAFFYYAGHGVSRGRGEAEALMTFSDLFDPMDSRLAKMVSARNIIYGMAPQSPGDRVARKQFFFFDCCRTFPEEMKTYDDKSVQPVLDIKVSEGVQDDRHYARFFAVPDTAAAYASIGENTYFCTSLIDALDNAGRNVSGSGWVLNGQAMQERLQVRYPLQANRYLDPVVIGKPVLRYLGAPPLVDVDVHLVPTDTAVNRTVGFEKAPNLIVGNETAVGKYRVQLLPGQYDFKVRLNGTWSAAIEQPIILPDFESPWQVTGWQ